MTWADVQARRAEAIAALATNVTPARLEEETRSILSESGKRGGRGKKGSVDHTEALPKPQGQNAARLTERIACDRPDVLERMKAGEFASVA